MTNEEKFLLLAAALIKDENYSEDEVINLIDSIINNEHVK